MKLSDGLAIFSQLINILIFIYFSIILLKINALDMIGLLISAFGIIMGLITSIVSVIETKK
jgi:hypothetical protein